MENQKENSENREEREEQVSNYLIPSRKRLYKSPHNYVLFGICGGIGDYLNISPILLRVLFVLTSLLGGWGIVAYFLSFILVPEHPSMKEYGILNKIFSKRALGFLLIGVGIYFWLPPFGVFGFISQLNVSKSLFLSSTVVVVGILILLRGSPTQTQEHKKPVSLVRLKSNRRLLGICSGLSVYLQTDINLIRFLFILLSFVTLGLTILFYFFIGFFIPNEEFYEEANG